ncbi:hypothetical protein C8Q76DRAFT_631050, partial [Earliella scabrosa]
ANSSSQAICAICLGLHAISEVARCRATSTWDGRPTRCSRDGNRIQTHSGSIVCTEWQRENSCMSTKHSDRHECSGCGQRDHGASRCPRAQKA